MGWNYRIVRYLNGDGYGLHEVYYDQDGLPWSMTANPISFTCGADEGPAGIKGSLLKARVDAIKRPIFDEPAKGKWPGKAPGKAKPRRKLKPFKSADELIAQLKRSTTPALSQPGGKEGG